MQKAPDRESEGFFSGLAQKYDSIWQTFILPERMNYTAESLGPEIRRLDRDTVFHRIDGTCQNIRGEKIELSFFQLQVNAAGGAQTHSACLVYLHSHGGNRLEALSLLRHAGMLNMNLCCFDFAGSGMSEGKYTTLGLRESEDCRMVVETLMRKYGQRRFVLWGRSMGAVAAILYAAGKQPHILSMVLDSPFSDVEQMVRDAGNAYMSLGEYLALFLFSMVKNDIKEHIGHDLSTFQPIKFCHLCEAPCIFIVGKNDPLVPPERVNQIYEAYKGVPKEIMVIEGSHSSSRQLSDIELVFKKLANHLQLEPKVLHSVSDGHEESKVRYGSSVVDKFEEIDSLLHQRKLERKISSQKLQSRLGGGDHQTSETIYQTRPQDTKLQREVPRASRISQFNPIKATTEVPFNVAPPRYLDFPQPIHSNRIEAPQLKVYNRAEHLTTSNTQTGLSFHSRIGGLIKQKEAHMNKENIQAISSGISMHHRPPSDLRKPNNHPPSSPMNGSHNIYGNIRPGINSDRSSSRNLMFSRPLQEKPGTDFQYQNNSPQVHATQTLRSLTSISPFQISPTSQKYQMPANSSRNSRPASPITTNKPANYGQPYQDPGRNDHIFIIPQEGNILDHQLQSGQIKAALQSRLKEKPFTAGFNSQLSSTMGRVQIPTRMMRTDSMHEPFSMEGSHIGNMRQDSGHFNKPRKSMRQMKIFDDLDDSPEEQTSISLFGHTSSLYPNSNRLANTKHKSPSAAYLGSTFK